MARTALEQPVQRSNAVGEIQRAVAVEVKACGTGGGGSSEEEIPEHRDRVTDIDSRILVEVTGDLAAAESFRGGFSRRRAVGLVAPGIYSGHGIGIGGAVFGSIIGIGAVDQDSSDDRTVSRDPVEVEVVLLIVVPINGHDTVTGLGCQSRGDRRRRNVGDHREAAAAKPWADRRAFPGSDVLDRLAFAGESLAVGETHRAVSVAYTAFDRDGGDAGARVGRQRGRRNEGDDNGADGALVSISRGDLVDLEAAILDHAAGIGTFGGDRGDAGALGDDSDRPALSSGFGVVVLVAQDQVNGGRVGVSAEAGDLVTAGEAKAVGGRSLDTRFATGISSPVTVAVFLPGVRLVNAVVDIILEPISIRVDRARLPTRSSTPVTDSV